jgi:hypothetical protein
MVLCWEMQCDLLTCIKAVCKVGIFIGWKIWQSNSRDSFWCRCHMWLNKSEITRWNLVVIICTTKGNAKNCAFSARNLLMYSVWFSRTVIVFLYNTVWTFYWKHTVVTAIYDQNFFVLCRGLQNPVPWHRRLDIGLSPQRSEFEPKLVYVRFVREKWHCDRFFSDGFGFLLLVSFHHLLLRVAVIRKTNRRSLGTFRIAMLYRKSGTIGWKSTFFSLQKVYLLVTARLGVPCVTDMRDKTCVTQAATISSYGFSLPILCSEYVIKDESPK